MPLSSNGKDSRFSIWQHGFDSRQGYCGVEKWLSRQPHKLKCVGSNPTSATHLAVNGEVLHNSWEYADAGGSVRAVNSVLKRLSRFESFYSHCSGLNTRPPGVWSNG